ncbi:hypothetical protein [Chitiniphilus shinanonensis]|uniref:hypothetical protein n=1 Tax=Chitiniphilus shinanonensis TaxID=553088 RepID=UPI0030461E21
MTAPRIIVQGGSSACRAHVRQVAHATLTGNPGYTGSKIIPFGDELAMLRFFGGRCVARVTGEGEPLLWGDVGSSPQLLRQPWWLDQRRGARLGPTRYHASSLAARPQYRRLSSSTALRPELHGGLYDRQIQVRASDASGQAHRVRFAASGFGIAPRHGPEVRCADDSDEAGPVGQLTGTPELWGVVAGADQVHPYAARWIYRNEAGGVGLWLTVAFADGVRHALRLGDARTNSVPGQVDYPEQFISGSYSDHDDMLLLLTTRVTTSVLGPGNLTLDSLAVHDVVLGGDLLNHVACAQVSGRKLGVRIERHRLRITRAGIELKGSDLLLDQQHPQRAALLFAWAELPWSGISIAPGTLAEANAAADDLAVFMEALAVPLRSTTWHQQLPASHGTTLSNSAGAFARPFNARLSITAINDYWLSDGAVLDGQDGSRSWWPAVFDAAGVPAGRAVVVRDGGNLSPETSLDPAQHNLMSSWCISGSSSPRNGLIAVRHSSGLPAPDPGDDYLRAVATDWIRDTPWRTLGGIDYHPPAHWAAMPYILGPNPSDVPARPLPANTWIYLADLVAGSGTALDGASLDPPLANLPTVGAGNNSFVCGNAVHVFDGATRIASAAADWTASADGRAPAALVISSTDPQIDGAQPYSPGKSPWVLRQPDGYATLLASGGTLGAAGGWGSGGPPSESIGYWRGVIADSTAASRPAVFDITDHDGTPTRCLIVGQYLDEDGRIRLVLVPAPGLAGPIVLDAQQFMALPPATAYPLASLPVVARGTVEGINAATVNWVTSTDVG